MSGPESPPARPPSAARGAPPDPAALASDPALLIRLAARAADPEVAPEADAREAVLGALGTASGERLRQELERVLLEPEPGPALRRLLETGVLQAVLPEVSALASLTTAGDRRHKDVWEHTLQVVARCPARQALRWAALLHDIGKVQTRRFASDGQVSFHGHAEVGAETFRRHIASRLAFPAPLGETVRFLIREHQRASQYETAWQDSAVRRFAREVGAHLSDLLDLARADVTSRIPGRREAAVRAIDELAARATALAELDARVPPLPPGLGTAIMTRFSLEAGPTIGRLRRALEQAVAEGRLAAQQPVETYLTFLEERALLEEPPGDD